MRIACLQFAPQVGDVDNNLNRAVGADSGIFFWGGGGRDCD